MRVRGVIKRRCNWKTEGKRIKCLGRGSEGQGRRRNHGTVGGDRDRRGKKKITWGGTARSGAGNQQQKSPIRQSGTGGGMLHGENKGSRALTETGQQGRGHRSFLSVDQNTKWG